MAIISLANLARHTKNILNKLLVKSYPNYLIFQEFCLSSSKQKTDLKRSDTVTFLVS